MSTVEVIMVDIIHDFLLRQGYAGQALLGLIGFRNWLVLGLALRSLGVAGTLNAIKSYDQLAFIHIQNSLAHPFYFQ